MGNARTNGTQSTTPTEVRLRLLQGGYHPLPLNGKAPTPKAWQTLLHTDPQDIGQWAEIWPDAINTGVLTRNCPVLDIDIEDPDAAQAAEALVRDRFGDDAELLIRIGNAPRRGIPFRTDTPFDKIAITLTARNGTEGQKVEFLADGQQCVVDGVHPATRASYVWFGGRSVLDHPARRAPAYHQRGGAPAGGRYRRAPGHRAWL